jgi:signal peptidase I
MSTVTVTPARSAARRWSARSVLSTIFVVALVAVWAVTLRPQALGGPTAIVIVSGTSMEPLFHTGDLVVVKRQRSYRVGDVVAYRVPEGSTGENSVVIHRIVGGSAAKGYVLRGDNRDTDDLWRPGREDVVGREWVAISTQGRILSALRSPAGVATLAALLTFVLVATGGRRGTRERR